MRKMPLKKASPSVSPGIPKAVALAVEADPNKDLHSIITTAISTALQPLIDKMDNLEKCFNASQRRLSEVENSTKESSQELAQTNQRVISNEAKIRMHAKNLETQEKCVIALQVQQAKTVLRLQNLPDSPGELKDQVCTLLAPLVKVPKEAFFGQIEAIYRISSAFIKKMNLPREVYIRFTNKKIRDDILKAANETPLIIGDKKLNFLKDVPFLARQKRKKYKVLTKLLIDNKIKYTWMSIEGLLFVYKGQSYKISSEAKLRDFLGKYGKDLGFKEAKTSDEPAERGESAEEVVEEQAAAGLAEITKQLKRYSFRERDK